MTLGQKGTVRSSLSEMNAPCVRPFARTQEGWTPLHLTALKGHRDVAGLLLSRGSSIEALTTVRGGCSVRPRSSLSPLSLPGASRAVTPMLSRHCAQLRAGGLSPVLSKRPFYCRKQFHSWLIVCFPLQSAPVRAHSAAPCVRGGQPRSRGPAPLPRGSRQRREEERAQRAPTSRRISPHSSPDPP